MDSHDSQLRTKNDNIQHELESLGDLENPDNTAALHVDLTNSGALKNDDSDGRVNWTPKQVLATIFLSGLYVGQSNPISHTS